MVNRKLLTTLILATISTSVSSKDVNNVEILSIGIAYEGHSETEKEGCKLFRPTKEQIINFFKNAQEPEYGGSVEHKYYSPCISTGTVTFTDGTSGEWTIQSSGFGYATFGDKKSINFFYKDNNWVDPFQCAYASGDEVEPGCEP